MTTQYPNLRKFIACYFHQDWTLDTPTVADAVDMYLSEWPEEYLPNTLNELKLLLEKSDDTLEEIIENLGSYYYPPGDNTNSRDWLIFIYERLKNHYAPPTL
jgi:CdiI immunity protein